MGDRKQPTSDSPDGNNHGTPVTGTPDNHNMVKHQRKAMLSDPYNQMMIFSV